MEVHLHGVVELTCSKLIDNMTGIKGTNVQLQIDQFYNANGSNNVFQNAPSPNSLLFDICYPVVFGGQSNNGTINASNNFWYGGFDNIKFNLMFGQGADCLNAGRRQLEQCSELLSIPTSCGSGSIGSCCGVEIKTSDGLNTKSSYTKQCFAGGGGTNALIMKNTNNQSATKADKDKFKIYPNPATETVQLETASGDYHIRVLNTVGQTIFTQNTEGPLSVNVATWTNGIYLFELTDKATNKQQRSKIVVQH